MNDVPGLDSTSPARRRLWRFHRRQNSAPYVVLGMLLLRVLVFGAIIVSAAEAPGTGTTVTGNPLILGLLPDGAYSVASGALVVALDLCIVAVITSLRAVTRRRLHDVNSPGGLFFSARSP